MSVRIKDTDRGMKRLLREMRKRGQHVVAGIPVGADEAKEGSEGGTLMEVAKVHEFGTSRIPKRSFVAATFDINRQRYANFAARKSFDVLEGRMSRERLLNQIGAAMVGDMKVRIANRIAPPLAESTIRRKGSSVPLIDTGQLRNSITHEVR